MSWSISLIVLASLSAPDAQATFGNYSKAYWTAQQAHRPMLVILNPSGQSGSQQEVITHETLQSDARTREMLDNYVVAIIDTGTKHGKAVHELFGSPQLPRVVVIDERQDKQVFQSSEHLAPSEFARILEQYRTNAATTATSHTTRFRPTTPQTTPQTFNSFQRGGNCPNCRRF